VPEHAAALERLRTDLILWLTTVRPGGQPQSTPVWFHFDGEGTARVDGGVPPADRMEDYVRKYQGQMAANGWTPESFAEDYVVPITVSPSRFRVW
jgi:Pyridoxamine 5'-phosphate oxidase